MRIGEFSSKLEITQDTIRHYMDLGLLIPQKNGGQFVFSRDDMDDMKRIIELKRLDFSLTEILKTLTYKRMMGTDSEEYKSLYLSLLEEKKNKVETEVQKYLELRAKLKSDIDYMKRNEKKEAGRIGFPMSAVPLLSCPQCREPLNILNGVIEKNMIFEAAIQCDCGYNAIIENGIYIDPKAVRKRTYPDGSSYPTREEYLAAASAKYINLRYKAIDMLINKIQKEFPNPRYILEMDPCVSLFLMQFIKYLPKDTTYILNDVDCEKLTFTKREIEMNYEHKRFLIFCCDIDALPLAKGSIDIIIDFLMTKAYAEMKQRFVIARTLPLLQKNGLLAGIYPHFRLGARDALSSPPQTREYLDKEHIQQKFRDLGIVKLHNSDIGPVVENNPYDLDIQGKELLFNIFAGKRDTVVKHLFRAYAEGIG